MVRIYTDILLPQAKFVCAFKSVFIRLIRVLLMNTLNSFTRSHFPGLGRAYIYYLGFL